MGSLNTLASIMVRTEKSIELRSRLLEANMHCPKMQVKHLGILIEVITSEFSHFEVDGS